MEIFSENRLEIWQRFSKIWELSEICLRNIWEMSEICQRIAWDLVENCLRIVRELTEACLRNALIFGWELSEICVRNVWELHEICPRTAWDLVSTGQREGAINYTPSQLAGHQSIKAHWSFRAHRWTVRPTVLSHLLCEFFLRIDGRFMYFLPWSP